MVLPTAKLGDPSDLQHFYDRILPNNSTVLNDYDSFTLRVRDIHLHLDDCRLDLSKDDPAICRRQSGYLRPVLRTGAEKPRQPGLIENVLALIKRNFNAPHLLGTVDVDAMADTVVGKFFEIFFPDGLDDCSNRLMSEESFNDWAAQQLPSTLNKLEVFDHIDLPAIDAYTHIIKRRPKIKLDDSICSSYPALQTIVYHSKEINAIFGPIFKELTRSFLSRVDATKFLFYTRKTPEDIEEFFSDLPPVDQTDVYELDISKYDKSQNELHCAIEYAVWKRLGFHGFLAKVWEQGHRRTVSAILSLGSRPSFGFKGKVGMSQLL